MRVETRDDVRERQNLIIVGLLALIVILVVAWALYSSYESRLEQERLAMNPPVPAIGTAPGVPVPPAGVQPSPALPVPSPSTPATPGAGPRPSVTPSVPVAPTPKPAPRSSTVLGSVVVTYPGGWGLNTGAEGAAILSDGKATLEIEAADPAATDAKSAADLALAARAPGADIKAQGARTISGHDAYAYMLGTSAGSMRIVGVDAPTRIVIVESAAGNQLAAHRAAFDKVESGLRFK